MEIKNNTKEARTESTMYANKKKRKAPPVPSALMSQNSRGILAESFQDQPLRNEANFFDLHEMTENDRISSFVSNFAEKQYTSSSKRSSPDIKSLEEQSQISIECEYRNTSARSVATKIYKIFGNNKNYLYTGLPDPTSLWKRIFFSKLLM